MVREGKKVIMKMIYVLVWDTRSVSVFMDTHTHTHIRYKWMRRNEPYKLSFELFHLSYPLWQPLECVSCWLYCCLRFPCPLAPTHLKPDLNGNSLIFQNIKSVLQTLLRILFLNYQLSVIPVTNSPDGRSQIHRLLLVTESSGNSTGAPPLKTLFLRGVILTRILRTNQL